MNFDQFLVRQRRTKVGLVGVQQLPRFDRGFLRQLIVAGLPTLFGGKALGTLVLDDLLQAFELAGADT